MNHENPTTYFTGDAYGPEDAEAQRKVIEFLRTATRAERFATLVQAGICDEDGRLLPPYADDSAR